jgi:hypothetical protein
MVLGGSGTHAGQLVSAAARALADDLGVYALDD